MKINHSGRYLFLATVFFLFVDNLTHYLKLVAAGSITWLEKGTCTVYSIEFTENQLAGNRFSDNIKSFLKKYREMRYDT